MLTQINFFRASRINVWSFNYQKYRIQSVDPAIVGYACEKIFIYTKKLVPYCNSGKFIFTLTTLLGLKDESRLFSILLLF